MNGLEIKNMLEDGYLPPGASVGNQQVTTWINMAVSAIQDEYPVDSTETYTVEAGKENELPTGYLKIAEVRDAGGLRCLDYAVTPDKKIIFQHGGKYTVKYHRLPAMLDSIDDTPDADEAFHMAIIEYCMAKFWELESEGADQGSLVMSKQCEDRFYIMVRRTAEALKEGVRVTRHIKKAPWSLGR